MIKATHKFINRLDKRCPVIECRENNKFEKLSAYWIIEEKTFIGKCLRFRDGKCELNNAQCYYHGIRDFSEKNRMSMKILYGEKNGRVSNRDAYVAAAGV